MAERLVKVIWVIRNDCGWPIWVRIQYIKDRKLLHDAIFIRGKDREIVLAEKRIDNYIPPKRLGMMYAKAVAIMHCKKPAPATQLDLPLIQP